MKNFLKGVEGGEHCEGSQTGDGGVGVRTDLLWMTKKITVNRKMFEMAFGSC